MTAPTTRPIRLALAAGIPVLALLLGGCSSAKGHISQPVLTIKAGECFTSPTKVQAQLSSLPRVPCSVSHNQESYAVVAYTPTGSSTTSSAYPGSDVLSSFAQGVCAQEFTSYVGIDYLDSKLYFTYLMPSARSWETDDDRNVICFITRTGAPLTASVKGTKQ